MMLLARHLQITDLADFGVKRSKHHLCSKLFKHNTSLDTLPVVKSQNLIDSLGLKWLIRAPLNVFLIVSCRVCVYVFSLLPTTEPPPPASVRTKPQTIRELHSAARHHYIDDEARHRSLQHEITDFPTPHACSTNDNIICIIKRDDVIMVKCCLCTLSYVRHSAVIQSDASWKHTVCVTLPERLMEEKSPRQFISARAARRGCERTAISPVVKQNSQVVFLKSSLISKEQAVERD